MFSVICFGFLWEQLSQLIAISVVMGQSKQSVRRMLENSNWNTQ